MFRFLRDVVVECVPYKAGDVVPVGDIPAGSHECLLNHRHAELYTPPAPPAAPEVPDQPTPKPAAKKAAKAASAPSE